METACFFEVRRGVHVARRPFTLPLGGSKTSLRVFGEGLAALRKTLPGRSLLTADPPRGRVKEIAQLQNSRFGLVRTLDLLQARSA